jgi:uncharacterized protein (TIGR03032 family)
MSEPSAQLRYEATTGFMRILDTCRCSLAISVYMSSRVILVSAENSRIFVDSFSFRRPMGIAPSVTDGALRLAIATFDEVVILADAPLLAASLPGKPGSYQHLLVPRATLFTGDIDAHDLAWVGNQLCAANTRFSCIAAIDGRCSFTPVWTPPFVSHLMPEDRCHLNGLAVAGDRIVYATAFAQADQPRGWSERRFTGGVLMEVPSGRVVLDDLCMPHSPRVFDGQLHVLDSGTGRVLRVDPGRQTVEPLAELPGFTRGFDRYGDILFVGLSRIRRRDQPGGGPPIAAKPDELVCGVAAVERQHGRILGYFKFDDTYDEIFDIKVLPNFQRGGMLSVDDDGHRRALVLPGRAFWGEKIEKDSKK